MAFPSSLMTATYEGFAGADVCLMTRFDEETEQDALLLQFMGSPELCEQNLVKVKYERRAGVS